MTAQITYTSAEEWIDLAPKDIRASTERAAVILRECNLLPRVPADLADARKEIAEYAAEYCREPVDCIADVERNPRLPCING